MWYDPGCGEGLAGNCWQRVGWFPLWPGESKQVLPNALFPDVGDDLSDVNSYYCFYAMADDGAKWYGPYPRGVTYQVFHRCDCLHYTLSDFVAGFRLFDVDDYDDYTITLVPR